MITAQDIREKTFEKSRMNGYDMASVDDFLEELAEDISSSQKENAVLKSKMKVLVDKIEEYRANEEALNLAILSAQKLAVQIESEARQRAAAPLKSRPPRKSASSPTRRLRPPRSSSRFRRSAAASSPGLPASAASCSFRKSRQKRLPRRKRSTLTRRSAPSSSRSPVRPLRSPNWILTCPTSISLRLPNGRTSAAHSRSACKRPASRRGAGWRICARPAFALFTAA